MQWWSPHSKRFCVQCEPISCSLGWIHAKKYCNRREYKKRRNWESTANEIPMITSWVAGCTLKDHMCNGNFREKSGKEDIFYLLYGSAGLFKSNGGMTGDWWIVQGLDKSGHGIINLAFPRVTGVNHEDPLVRIAGVQAVIRTWHFSNTSHKFCCFSKSVYWRSLRCAKGNGGSTWKVQRINNACWINAIHISGKKKFSQSCNRPWDGSTATFTRIYLHFEGTD